MHYLLGAGGTFISPKTPRRIRARVKASQRQRDERRVTQLSHQFITFSPFTPFLPSHELTDVQFFLKKKKRKERNKKKTPIKPRICESYISERCQLDKQQIIQNVITAGRLFLPIFPITPATLSYQKNNHIRERVASLTHL